MDLRSRKITVGELLDNPRSKAVFQRRFGKFMKHPMVGAARSLTLAQLQEMAAVYIPQKTIQDTLKAGETPENSGFRTVRTDKIKGFLKILGCHLTDFRIE